MRESYPTVERRGQGYTSWEDETRVKQSVLRCLPGLKSRDIRDETRQESVHWLPTLICRGWPGMKANYEWD
jgi:hypothetical protein